MVFHKGENHFRRHYGKNRGHHRNPTKGNQNQGFGIIPESLDCLITGKECDVNTVLPTVDKVAVMLHISTV